MQSLTMIREIRTFQTGTACHRLFSPTLFRPFSRIQMSWIDFIDFWGSPTPQMLEATVQHRCGSRFLRWKSLALVLSKQLCTGQLGQLKCPLRICSRAQEGYIKKVQVVGCSNLRARQAFPLRKISRSKVIWKNIRKIKTNLKTHLSL